MSQATTSGPRCRRVFLGWDRPFLPAAVTSLASELAEGGQLDLSQWVLALPTAQSRLRCAELLEQRCGQQGWDYRPPKFVTAGDLPERLYQPAAPLAIEFEQTLAWAKVLQRQDAVTLRPLVASAPETDSLTAWFELAATLRRLSTELAAHGVEFQAVEEVLDDARECERWRLLRQLNEQYLEQIAEAGLSDVHQQRRLAVREGRLSRRRRVALIGTNDLTESVAEVVAALPQAALALIAAPPDHQDDFDALGRLRADRFHELELSISDQQLVAAGDLPHQARLAGQWIERFAADCGPASVAAGVTDESHVGPLEIELQDRGHSSYRHLGWTVASTAVGRLIRLVANLVTRPTWQALAALVRHADAERCLAMDHEQAVDGDLDLVQLDELLAHHFPLRLADPLPPEAIHRYPRAVELAHRAVCWLSPFLGGATETSQLSGDGGQRQRQPIAAWCMTLQQWLAAVYPEGFAEAEPAIDRGLSVAAVRRTGELLERFAQLSGTLDVPVAAATGLEMIANRMSELRVGLEPQREDVQIHGWLDLALEDAPAMVVMGLNHPFVPQTVTSDPFLPGSLRSKLRVADNERRHARDLHALQLIVSTRPNVRLIVGKTAADGSPTPPSRLLAAADAEVIPKRMQRLLGPISETETGPRDQSSGRDSAGKATSDLPIPELSPETCPVSTMSVTAFKTYLECPYRFYLRHVLKLKPIDDASRELAANQFGDLVHAAVESFGKSDAKDEGDETRIYEALRHHLHRYVQRHYGSHGQRAVQLQVRQAEQRLKFVAASQARRIGEGWTIYATEETVDETHGAQVVVDGQAMGLRGRFDRIDHHAASGRWAILDYKTHGHTPEKKHLKRNRETGLQEWVDLQLPLYRRMVPALGIEAEPDEVELGYFNVSDKPQETCVHIAEFAPELLHQADQLIEDIVRRIFACDFAPRQGNVTFDDYGMILQTGVASRMLADHSIREGAESE